MKKYFALLILYFLSILPGQSQVGIPGNNPDKNAILDLNRTDGTSAKGLLLPKVSLTSTTSPDPLSSHTEGMYVYNTKATGSGATAVKEGPYYNTGTEWYPLFSDVTGWNTAGNSGTTTASNFLGTNDPKDLVVKTSGTERERITGTGQILVGTSTVPTGGNTAKLIINSNTAGALQLKDGTQGQNYVLTSDANGVGTWREQGMIVNNVPRTAPAGVNIPSTPLNKWYYSNVSVTLPPGKWLVSATMILSKRIVATGPSEYWFVTSTFSDSATVMDISPNIQPGKFYISGILNSSIFYNIMKGSVIITNNTAANKTYYYIGKISSGRNMTGSLDDFGAGWAENVITYKQIN